MTRLMDWGRGGVWDGDGGTFTEYAGLGGISVGLTSGPGARLSARAVRWASCVAASFDTHICVRCADSGSLEVGMGWELVGGSMGGMVIRVIRGFTSD